MKPTAYRLPTHVRPRQYDVQLEARLGRAEFSGQVTLHLDVLTPTDTIELHARGLQLAEARLQLDARTLAGQIQLLPEHEAAAVRCAETLPAGPAALTLKFRGEVATNLKGLYLSADGPERLLCTQCEATDARAIFPCFDEPEFKARFQFAVTTDRQAVVLANSPLLAVTAAPGGDQTWAFGPTQPMSSYLVALVIGDVAGTEAVTVAGTPLQVWTLRGKEAQGLFARDYAARLLPWYEDYFGVPYHFGKYDQVAVPGFAAGAMENSGLVLFRQAALLMDARTASWNQQKGIAHVVAHEFAHMWFGNLVTMRWWDDLWLNEAFAEWIGQKAVNELSPEYTVWEDFQQAKSGALATDALESTHPIYTPVATPAEAEEMFDAITYTKGCAVLRMLEHYLGAEPFRAGLRTYMRAFAERNAAGADLWRHLQDASREPVTQMMASWIRQGGYPVVAVAWDSANQTLHLAQRRFFSNPQAPADNDQTWVVPLVVRYEDESGPHTTRVRLDARQADVPLAVQGELRWLYANADEIGFYRQDLSRPLLQAGLAQRGRLNASEQMGLLSDQWALVRSGQLGLGQFLDVLTALSAAEDYHVLGEVVRRLHTVEALLEEAEDAAPALARFRGWVAGLFSRRLADLGFEPRADETQARRQERVAVVDALGQLAQTPAVIAECVRWADREAEAPSNIDANLAPVVIQIAARFGDAARLDRHVDVFRRRRAAGATPQERNRYLGSFGYFRPPDLVERVLRLIDEGIVPQENIGPLLITLLQRRHGQGAAWDFLQERWSLVTNLGGFWLGGLVEACGQLPAQKRAELVAFLDAHLDGQAQQSYARALETLDQLTEFKARARPELLAWFRAAA